MTTSNGKSAIESTEQSLPDDKQDSTEEMLAAAFKSQFGIDYFAAKELTDDEIHFNGFDAAIATKQTELESWQIAAENWHVHAVDWAMKNADLRAELAQANATIAALETKRDGAIEQWLQECEIRRALQAKIAEQDKQEPLIFADVGHLREVSNGNSMPIYASCEQDEQRRLEPLFTRPPITAERELELLGVIKQMREFISLVKETGFMRDEAKEALALTPDMTAFKEHSSD